MLRWYKKLYIGDNAKKRASQTIKRIDQGKYVRHVYLITLASNPENLLDIIDAKYLLQKTVRRLCPTIVGLGSGYGEALDLVRQIVTETWQEQGDTDVRRYLNTRLKQDDENQAGE